MALHGEPITASIGIASAEASDREFGDVLWQADQSLYRAKKLGRNRVIA